MSQLETGVAITEMGQQGTGTGWGHVLEHLEECIALSLQPLLCRGRSSDGRALA